MKASELIKENNEIQDRITNICAFMGTSDFLDLSPSERLLVDQQRSLMVEYRNTLDCRIELRRYAEITKDLEGVIKKMRKHLDDLHERRESLVAIDWVYEIEFELEKITCINAKPLI